MTNDIGTILVDGGFIFDGDEFDTVITAEMFTTSYCYMIQKKHWRVIIEAEGLNFKLIKADKPYEQRD